MRIDCVGVRRPTLLMCVGMRIVPGRRNGLEPSSGARTPHWAHRTNGVKGRISLTFLIFSHLVGMLRLTHVRASFQHTLRTRSRAQLCAPLYSQQLRGCPFTPPLMGAPSANSHRASHYEWTLKLTMGVSHSSGRATFK